MAGVDWEGGHSTRWASKSWLIFLIQLRIRRGKGVLFGVSSVRCALKWVGLILLRQKFTSLAIFGALRIILWLILVAITALRGRLLVSVRLVGHHLLFAKN